MTDIFIRTYHKDIEWLKYCLRSIQKYARGINEVIICIPQAQKHLLEELNLTRERIVTCPDYERDYLGQQVSKLRAFEYSKADHILYADSDCTFIKECTPESFMKGGKPLILMTDYSKVGDAICWQGVTEKFIGFKPVYEYMRRMPLLYHRSTIEGLWEDQERFEEKILSQPNDNFSEFNLLGAYAHENDREKYHFQNTDSGLPEEYLKQHWSWGGLTPEVRNRIESYL